MCNNLGNYHNHYTFYNSVLIKTSANRGSWAILFQATISDISFPCLSLFYLCTDILKYSVHTIISFNLKAKVSNVPTILEKGEDGFQSTLKNNFVLLYKSTIYCLYKCDPFIKNLPSRFFSPEKDHFMSLFTFSGKEATWVWQLLCKCSSAMLNTEASSVIKERAHNSISVSLNYRRGVIKNNS
jgi:hypothetical protein